MTAPMTLLKVEDLRTYFATPTGIARAVDGISFSLNAGETLAVVGTQSCVSFAMDGFNTLPEESPTTIEISWIYRLGKWKASAGVTWQ
ncbi:MAG: hypothetical protein NTV34_18370 [Proteobacteria bacterium]|nr:hypothetical protein [Pseudomonadota bacterium]